jgi:TM2 domain.
MIIDNKTYIQEPLISENKTNNIKSLDPIIFVAIIYAVCCICIFISISNYISDNNSELDLLISSNFTCVPNTKDIECNYHGVCTSAGDDCICDEHYITYNPPNNTKCNYKQKKRLVAFLLQFYFGALGAGEWYLGNNDLACFIVMYTLLIIFAIWLSNLRRFDMIAPILCLWFIGLVIWMVFELVVIGSGIRLDGNDLPMTSW